MRFFFWFILILFTFFLFFFSCYTGYQFERITVEQSIKQDFSYPEKNELGKYSNLTDSKIRVNILIAQGSSFILSSDSTIYKDNKPLETSQKNEYEITFKDVNSSFLSFTPLILNGKKISNIIKVEKKDQANIYIISNIPLIYYLAGVISAEMGKSFPPDALKAQAIASRTYFYSNRLENQPFDIINSTNFQVFNFENIEYFIPIVASVDNLVLTYKGKVFPSFFHSHSGGILTTPELVWGKSKIEYYSIYKVKKDLYSKPDYSWKAEVGRFFLKTLFLKYGFAVDGYCSNIEILSIGIDSRIAFLKLTFSNGKVIELNGDSFRKIVGTTVIKSTNFNFSYDSNTQNYIFSGIGYGHGIGMSQYGAKTMAENGFNYEYILLFYYNDVTIESKR